VHVLQLLDLFLLAPQIEIVKTALPELTGRFALLCQPARNAQLDGLD
jgi:hypothetical protein